ncbi:pirin family protein [Paraburkholderia fungorum]|nr:pirin family protein [Paraburkholderia fungorum]
MLVKSIQISRPTNGAPFNIGRHFSATSFKQHHFGGLMEPLLMVDEFRMRAPTFGPHPHAGFSAITYLFEDSKNHFLNHDSLGNDRVISPGSLHWLAAGSGVVHDEWPGTGADPEAHGLQFFVNLPAGKRHMKPYAVHLESENVPVHLDSGIRVRIVAGELAGKKSPVQLPQEFSIFDGFMEQGSSIDLPSVPDGAIWLYAMDGNLQVSAAGQPIVLRKGFAISIEAAGGVNTISLTATEQSHFVMMSGAPEE